MQLCILKQNIHANILKRIPIIIHSYMLVGNVMHGAVTMMNGNCIQSAPSCTEQITL